MRIVGGAVLILAVVGLTACVVCETNGPRRWIARLFGPPSVTLREQYARKPDGPRFDHSTFDELMKTYVHAGGWVDYAGLVRDADRLDNYLASLAGAPLDRMGRDERLAFLINAYNACTLRLILDHYPLPSIRDIPDAQRWDAQRWHIGGHVWSLTQIEHEQIRPRFREPRIHFALVCAAASCPPLRNETYDARRLDAQLDDQARYVHTHPRWFQFDSTTGVVRLTKLYDPTWYGSDFEQVAPSVLAFAARYVPALSAAMDAGSAVRIEWMNYDWALNDLARRPGEGPTRAGD